MEKIKLKFHSQHRFQIRSLFYKQTKKQIITKRKIKEKRLETSNSEGKPAISF